MAKSVESLEKIPAAKVMKYETVLQPAPYTHYTVNNLVRSEVPYRWEDSQVAS